MEDPECIHLLTLNTCTICNGKDRAIKEAEVKQANIVDYGFTAKYDGTCIICEGEIYEGHKCVRLVSGGIAHEDCFFHQNRIVDENDE